MVSTKWTYHKEQSSASNYFIFFQKVCFFSLSTFYKELIWCTNYPNVNIHIFCKCLSFIWCKLEDIGSPLRLLESFFDDASVDMIACYTELYGNREKAHTCFEINNEIFRLLWGTLLLIGCHQLPDCKMYWEIPPDNFVQKVSDSMLRDMFEHILQNLNLCDNEKLDK